MKNLPEEILASVNLVILFSVTKFAKDAFTFNDTKVNFFNVEFKYSSNYIFSHKQLKYCLIFLPITKPDMSSRTHRER